IFLFVSFSFFSHLSTTALYALSLHDALPICLTRTVQSDTLFDFGAEVTDQTLNGPCGRVAQRADGVTFDLRGDLKQRVDFGWIRSEEHTSELQSRENLVCRLLLEKKKEQ